MPPEQQRILIVDDDPQVRQLYTTYLADSYTVVTAPNGEDALDAVDTATDLVVLDRRMPGLSGDEVLEKIRARGLDCPVIMVTAVDPGADIIRLPFNEYLMKPISIEELQETVQRTLTLARRDIQMQEYFALQSKRLALEADPVADELETNDAYTDLVDQIDRLHDRIDPPIQEFEEEFATQLVSDIEQ